jgi:hypothetical protein
MSADDVRRRLQQAAEKAAADPTERRLPESREVIEETVRRWLDPARYATPEPRPQASREQLERELMAMIYPPSRRTDGRTREEVNRAAKLRALRLGWDRRRIPWDQAAAEALVAGRPGLAARHLGRTGFLPWGS